mgnify:CR=1 FL=1
MIIICLRKRRSSKVACFEIVATGKIAVHKWKLGKLLHFKQ